MLRRVPGLAASSPRPTRSPATPQLGREQARQRGGEQPPRDDRPRTAVPLAFVPPAGAPRSQGRARLAGAWLWALLALLSVPVYAVWMYLDGDADWNAPPFFDVFGGDTDENGKRPADTSLGRAVVGGVIVENDPVAALRPRVSRTETRCSSAASRAARFGSPPSRQTEPRTLT